MKNNASYFILKTFFFLEIFEFFPDFFGHVGKRLDKKAKINFKAYDVTSWEINNYNEHLVRHLEK